jgi:hypothetical protein
MSKSASLVAAAGFIGLIATSVAAADSDVRTESRPTTEIVAANLAGNTAPNCLLPGQIRKFGDLTMVTPRQPVQLDAAACAARGGELIADAGAD